jgi:DNA-3-methyladenine glycosylase
MDSRVADVREALGRRSLAVAPDLLGWRLHHATDDGVVTIELTEVEAYAGAVDPASHAYQGRTPRNAVMFGPAGRLYVYRSHGIHWCANLVTGADGEASAVLLRAGRVVGGLDLARARRGPRVPDRSLARGPGCLTQALGVDDRHGGVDLLADGSLRLEPGEPCDRPVSTGPRVGVSVAADRPRRFWVTGDETASAYRRSPRADRPGSAP